MTPKKSNSAAPAAKRPVGRPVSSSKTKEIKAKNNNKDVEQLYAQFMSLMKKKKVSRRDIASKISMSYQGFLNSFNNRNLKIETWLEISAILEVPFVARFETGRAPLAEESVSQTTVQAPASDDFTALRLNNTEEKVSILERQIASLEAQLKDKQTIIELLGEKIK